MVIVDTRIVLYCIVLYCNPTVFAYILGRTLKYISFFGSRVILSTAILIIDKESKKWAITKMNGPT